MSAQAVDGCQAREGGARARAEAACVLCVRLDNIGDVLMCTPAVRALAHALPGRSLTLLASPAAAAVAPFIPELRAVLTYSTPWAVIRRGGGLAWSAA